MQAVEDQVCETKSGQGKVIKLVVVRHFSAGAAAGPTLPATASSSG